MKYQKMIRISMMALGLGTAALLAKPVCAQQDVDPQTFEATSDSQVQTVAQAAPSLEAAQAPAIASAAATPLAEQEAEVAQLTPVDNMVTAVLLLGIGSIVLLGMAEAVRGSRRRTWKARTMDSYPVGSAAN
ncbi:MAG TPA: hypothetical protein VH114_08250 [Candidatus Acidoferrum sp.]|jgi:hypothetical protein|nr:hypothetical protein [Candidatus Acidoferrum sp.]